jgi:hypothetical protein
VLGTNLWALSSILLGLLTLFLVGCGGFLWGSSLSFQSSVGNQILSNVLTLLLVLPINLIIILIRTIRYLHIDGKNYHIFELKNLMISLMFLIWVFFIMLLYGWKTRQNAPQDEYAMMNIFLYFKKVFPTSMKGIFGIIGISFWFYLSLSILGLGPYKEPYTLRYQITLHFHKSDISQQPYAFFFPVFLASLILFMIMCFFLGAKSIEDCQSVKKLELSSQPVIL